MVDERVEFCRFAGEHGFRAGVTGTVAALEAVRQVSGSDPDAMRFALRAALCSSKEEWDLFNQWFGAHAKPAAKPEPPRNTLWLPGAAGANSSAVPQDGEGKAALGASLQERLRKTDFSAVPPAHQRELERVAQRLLRQLSYRLSRRLKIAERKGRVDLRRTIRHSISRGGAPFDLRYRNRKLREARLILLLDVSGSMNLYSLFLLRFAHALARYFQQARIFLFSTGLVNVTSTLRSRTVAQALRAIAQVPAGWSGGTKIGASLHDFNRRYGHHGMRRDTLFIIMSDGWDTGDPEVLASELRAIRRRVRKVVWLNPLLGLEDYRPVTRGMAAALPYIDVFHPAHSLESLLDLERHLCLTNS